MRATAGRVVGSMATVGGWTMQTIPKVFYTETSATQYSHDYSDKVDQSYLTPSKATLQTHDISGIFSGGRVDFKSDNKTIKQINGSIQENRQNNQEE